MNRVGLILLACISLSAFAQDEVDPDSVQTYAYFGDWDLQCARFTVDKVKKICRLSQKLKGGDENHKAYVSFMTAGDLHSLRISTSQYAATEMPVQISLDGRLVDKKIFECKNEVCAYTYTITDEVLTKLYIVDEIEVTVPGAPGVTYALDMHLLRSANAALVALQSRP